MEDTEELKPLVYSIAETIKISKLGKTNIYDRIREGELKVTRIGRRTLVRADSLHKLLNLED